MAITKCQSGTGGKFCKRPLQRDRFTPYGRPAAADNGACRPPRTNEAGGSGWFSRFVDPAARVLRRSISSFFSYVFCKGITATPGENIYTVENVQKMKSSPEVGEQSENTIDITLSICYDGSDTSKKEILATIDAIVQFEEPVNQKEFLRVECENSSINPRSSHQIAKNEKEKKANVNIREECSGSPTEIARAYLDSMNKKATPVVALQSKIYHKHKVEFGNKLTNDAIASKFALCVPIISKDVQNNYMTQKLRGNSRLCKLPRYPCQRSSIMVNPKEYTHYKDNDVKPIASSIARHFGLGHALKRSSSDRDVGCFGDARRVRHKPLLRDLNLITHADNSSSHFLGQEHKRSTDLKAPDNEGFRRPFASGIRAPPPRSVELAKKILHTLD